MAEESGKAGVPPWMVSFGDMMTLILTFFILLVSLSKEQQEGLMAKGIGSFLVAMRSFGLDGILGDAEKTQIYEGVRMKFNLPLDDDASDHLEASNLELIRAKVAQGLEPHGELGQPAVATFPADSAELTPGATRFLDLLAQTLLPYPGQVLLLEGHATDAGPTFRGDNHLLAFARAEAVRRYLVDEHGFRAARVEARAWLGELPEGDVATRSVDARLLTPTRTQRD
jgi:chemotaxis protein MotB